MAAESVPPVELVTESAGLLAAVAQARREQRVGVDTESNSFCRYPERLSLIQLATTSRIYLIDPLAVEQMAPLGALLADGAVEKVFHSSDYDVRSLDREWQFSVRGLFDTSIASAFVGMRQRGTATVLKERLGVSIVKEKALQRQDWSARPLSGRALEYAVADVGYLLELRRDLGEELARLGRTEWVAEECARLEAVRYRPPDPETQFLHVKGSRDLDGRCLAVLRELVAFREEEALRIARPPRWVLSDAQLVRLASLPEADLHAVVDGGRHPRRTRFLLGLERAHRAGRSSPPVRRVLPERRTRRPRLSVLEQQRLRHLKAWRMRQGDVLGLDPALLWPLVSLERLACGRSSLLEELGAPEVRSWQGGLFRQSLEGALAAL